MVPVDKFFIYGGGRWREVDTGSGRIDGWGRTKFLIARGGKLQAARSKPVLAALKALAVKKPSAAKEGLQLPYIYPPQRCASRERDKLVGCNHCQCCHHSSSIGSNCNSKPTEKKASIAIQCDKVDPRIQSAQIQNTNIQAKSDQNNIPRVTSKRKRDSISSEDLFQRKVITVATVHSPRSPEPKRHKTNSSIKSPKKGGSKQNRQSSSSTEENQAIATIKKSPTLKLRRLGPLKRKRSSSKETSPLFNSKLSDDIRRWNKISKYLQPRSKKVQKNENSDGDGLRRSTRKNTSIVITSDESDFKTKSKSQRQKISKRQRSSSTDIPIIDRVDLKNAIEGSSTDEPLKHKPGPKCSKNHSGSKRSTEEAAKHIRPGSKRDPGPSSRKPQIQEESEDDFQEMSSQQSTSKELVIDERDVEILRLYLQKNFDDEELLRFDTDDACKKKHFYRINPLVLLERCPRIAEMIRADSQLSLVDFASKLGLRSVSEVSSIKPKRYKTRRREERDRNNRSKSEDSDTETEEKENLDRSLSSRKKDTKKVLRESKSMERNKTKDVREERDSNKRTRDYTMDTVELSSASETEQRGSKTVVKKSPLFKKAKPKATVSTKRAKFKEYSNLEDHAIVSWVSVGGRASSVNGNKLWRQLQEQFHRLTGNGRTWHSLRNRYLRYILPRLSSLALPPSQQARLRAAAATGEIKGRRMEPRRNSMFALPPKGASSRRPPVFREEMSEEETVKEPNKSPGKGKAANPPRAVPLRYSDVTRQFAQRHRAQQHSSDRSSARSKDDESRRKSPSNKRTHSPSNKSRRSPRYSSRVISSSESPRKQSLSPKRKSNRRKLPSESSGDDFETKRRKSRSWSPSRPNRRKSSDTSSDDSSNASRDSLSEPSRRKSNRHKSQSELNRRSLGRRRPNESIRINSSSESNRRNPKRSNSPSESRRRNLGRNDSPIELNRRKSNRHKSPSELNSRKANRTDSPSETNRKKLPDESRPKQNRTNSPSESNRCNVNKLNSPSESNRRKLPDESNRRKGNRTNSPSESNRRKSNRHKSKSESSSNLQRRRSNRHKSPTLSKRRSESANHSSPSRQLRSDISINKPSPMKRTRKLFNPRAAL